MNDVGDWEPVGYCRICQPGPGFRTREAMDEHFESLHGFVSESHCLRKLIKANTEAINRLADVLGNIRREQEAPK